MEMHITTDTEIQVIHRKKKFTSELDGTEVILN